MTDTSKRKQFSLQSRGYRSADRPTPHYVFKKNVIQCNKKTHLFFNMSTATSGTSPCVIRTRFLLISPAATCTHELCNPKTTTTTRANQTIEIARARLTTELLQLSDERRAFI